MNDYVLCLSTGETFMDTMSIVKAKAFQLPLNLEADITLAFTRAYSMLEQKHYTSWQIM